MVSSLARPAASLSALTAKLPSKSLLQKHAGKTRSRDESGIDLESDDTIPTTPLSPTKRARVSFQAIPDVRIMEDQKEKNAELIQEEVRRGIEGHKYGEEVLYQQVVDVFTTKAIAEEAPSPTTIRNYTVALLTQASRLTRSCNALVSSALESDWIGRDEAYIALYIRFLATLVSAQGTWVPTVLKMLVGKLHSLPTETGRHPNQPIVRRPQLYTRAHTALKHLLKLIPSASAALVPILPRNFPFATDTKKAHLDYINNLLHITSYAPELKSDILGLITDRLVKIDVQIQIDMEEFEDIADDSIVRDITTRNGTIEGNDDSDESDPYPVSSEESMDEEERQLKEVRDNVRKIDGILDILFSYYEPVFLSPDSPEATRIFQLLLNHFQNIILPTYRSRHTQFLLFHFGQKSGTLVDLFAGTCVRAAFETGRAEILKQSSAAYLASFVARGAHVSTKIIRDVFDIIGQQLEPIRVHQEKGCQGPDLRKYGTFYALVQALLYVFCFRWRELVTNPETALEDEDGNEFVEIGEIVWVPGCKDLLTRLIYSKFNPLKVCSPSIVAEFAKIAHHLRFMYVYPLIEKNRRLHLSSFASNGTPSIRETAMFHRQDDSAHQLDAYFPFDPYHLPQSKRWIENDYVEWRGVPGLDDDKPEEGESDEGDEEDMMDAKGIESTSDEE